MVGRRSVATSLVAFALALGRPLVAQPPLEEFVAQGSVAFAADSLGGVACWLRDQARVLAWSRDGSPRSDCTLDDPRLPFTPNLIAYHDGVALLSFFDFAPGSESQRKSVVLDTERCEILATSHLPGVVHSLAATADGWLALSREPFDPTSTVLHLDRAGRIVDAFSLDRTFDRLIDELGIDENPLARTGSPFAVGRDVWLLPNAAYELWYPPQRGRSLRRVAPPECLAAEATQLRGSERAALLEARAARFPESFRAPLEAMIRSPSTAATLVSATAGVSVLGDLVAVKVIDPRSPDGARLDLWELTTEQVVATVPFAGGDRVLTVADVGIWVVEQGQRVRRRSLQLPIAGGDVPDPCREVGQGLRSTAAVLQALGDGPR